MGNKKDSSELALFGLAAKGVVDTIEIKKIKETNKLILKNQEEARRTSRKNQQVLEKMADEREQEIRAMRTEQREAEERRQAEVEGFELEREKKKEEEILQIIAVEKLGIYVDHYDFVIMIQSNNPGSTRKEAAEILRKLIVDLGLAEIYLPEKKDIRDKIISSLAKRFEMSPADISDVAIEALSSKTDFFESLTHEMKAREKAMKLRQVEIEAEGVRKEKEAQRERVVGVLKQYTPHLTYLELPIEGCGSEALEKVVGELELLDKFIACMSSGSCSVRLIPSSIRDSTIFFAYVGIIILCLLSCSLLWVLGLIVTEPISISRIPGILGVALFNFLPLVGIYNCFALLKTKRERALAEKSIVRMLEDLDFLYVRQCEKKERKE